MNSGDRNLSLALNSSRNNGSMSPEEEIEISARVQENIWIEIIRRMEALYAELVDTHSEAETRSAELTQSKEFTENIIRSMVNALIVVDANATITMANEAAAGLLEYGKEELVGTSLEVILHENEKESIRREASLWRELVDRGYVKNREVTCLSRRGSSIPVSFSGSVLRDERDGIVGVVWVGEDLRETKRLLREAADAADAERAKSAELEEAYGELQNLQAHLVQSEKMSSLGRMAAGVAHEINNPLGGIVLYSHLLLEDTPADDPRRENLEKIVREATRCGEIVRGLLGFARPRVDVAGMMNPVRAINDTLGVLKGQASFQNVEIVCEFESNLPDIPGDEGQIEQAFMNIIVNAADAMEGNGRLVLEAGLDKESDTTAVRISDTGPGIEQKDAERLFEPFFTTKPPGKGVGLGLAITYGIIKHHKGTITVESKPGEGTTFEVRLPCGLRDPKRTA